MPTPSGTTSRSCPRRYSPRRRRRRPPGRRSLTISPGPAASASATNWMVGYGSFTTDGTQALSGTDMGSGNWARFLGDLGTNDYSVTAVMSIPSTSSDSGVLARSPSSPSIFHRPIQAGSPPPVAVRWCCPIRQLERGNSLDLPTTITANTLYTLKLVATGTNPVHLEVWLNGVKKIDYNDSSANRITVGRAWHLQLRQRREPREVGLVPSRRLGRRWRHYRPRGCGERGRRRRECVDGSGDLTCRSRAGYRRGQPTRGPAFPQHDDSEERDDHERVRANA